MSAEGRTLTERLREALGEHQYALSCIHQGHTTSLGYPDHLADVTARVVEAWLGEQREAMAAAIINTDYPDGSDTAPVDAAIAALRAGIGAEG